MTSGYVVHALRRTLLINSQLARNYFWLRRGVNHTHARRHARTDTRSHAHAHTHTRTHSHTHTRARSHAHSHIHMGVDRWETTETRPSTFQPEEDRMGNVLHLFCLENQICGHIARQITPLS